MTRSPLFSPARFASLEARNRIAMPAIHLGRAPDGRPSEALLDLYEARAKGGAGIVTVGVCDAGGPSRDGGPALAGVLSLANDGCAAAMAALAQRIKSHGALAGAQIAPFVGYNDPRWHPDLSGVREISAAMGRAAARAEAAGFDFVELMLSGGSVLSHFVSRALNTFALPGYSGSLENRLRLAVESIAAIRSCSKLVVGARVHCHEFLDGGYGADEAARIAAALERAGIEALNITGGGHRTKVPQITHQVPPLAFADHARRIVEAVGITTLFGGQLRTREDAEAALEATGCDFVNVGRALLADPEWPAKIDAGREIEVVPCMTCCRCFDDVFSKRAVACAANPDVERRTIAARRAVPRKAKALVVGAGPAGMQAALELFEAGYDVTLAERAPVLGGRWRTAARLDGMNDLRRALLAKVARVERCGIEIRTGLFVTPELARSIGADGIVLAVGAEPRLGLGDPRGVLSAEAAIDDPLCVGARAAIIGGGGVGLCVAVHLARAGAREVSLVKRRGILGRGIGRSVRWTVVQEAALCGVRVFEQTSDLELSDGRVSFVDEGTGERTALDVDGIVLASGYVPPADLAGRFEGAARKIAIIGDARTVGGIGNAIADAHRAAAEILG
jgi:2,4-dienoyl-CoA reductase (NADPH2)